MPPALKGDGIVIGRVIDGTTEQPVGGALVTIPGRPADATLTDSDGRFAITDLPAGPIRLSAVKDGYADGGFGQRWIGLSALALGFGFGGGGPSLTQYLTLREGDRRDDIAIRLWKYGVITGRVADDAGDPVVGVTVQAWPRMLAGGRPTFNSTITYSSQTDDRGEFRIPRLLPGDYVVAVPAVSITIPASTQFPKNGVTKATVEIIAARRSLGLEAAGDRLKAVTSESLADGAWLTSPLGVPEPVATTRGWRGYATTLSPNAAATADAAVVNVTAGSERTADVQIRLQDLYSLSGTVADESGQPRAIGLRLLADGALVAMALSDGNGRFRFDDVPVGAYHIEVTVFPEAPPMPNAVPGYHTGGTTPAVGLSMIAELDTAPMSDEPTEWADVPVTVSAAAANVAVTLRPGSRITGHVVFSGQAAPAASLTRATTFVLERADGRPSLTVPRSTVLVNARGELRSVEFPPGRYLLRPSTLPPGWTIQSAMAGGKNIVVSPVELGGRAVDDLVVTLTTTPSVITGQVRQSAGLPDADASVVVFTTDSTHWVDYGERSRDIVPQRVTAEGRFTVRSLPAGTYFIVAVDDVVLARGLPAELLDALARVADRVTVADGQSRAIDLTTRVVR